MKLAVALLLGVSAHRHHHHHKYSDDMLLMNEIENKPTVFNIKLSSAIVNKKSNEKPAPVSKPEVKKLAEVQKE